MARHAETLLILALAAAPMAAAQTHVDGAAQLSRESIETQRRMIVGGSLPLTDSEAAAFWPLFDAYQRDLAPVRERSARIVTEFLNAGTQVTDQRALAMLSELLDADEQTLALRRKYMKQMGRALPQRKLALYFQLERKLDAVVAYEYAQRVPLLR